MIEKKPLCSHSTVGDGELLMTDSGNMFSHAQGSVFLLTSSFSFKVYGHVVVQLPCQNKLRD